MPSERDVAEFWAARALDSQYHMLDLVQSSAGKWEAAIAAFLGVYATVGFVWGPDKLATLPLSGGARTVALGALGLAGGLGLVAGILANLAAQGVPVLFHNRLLTGPELMQRTAAQARTAQRRLLAAMLFAAVAGAFVLAVTLWMLIAAAIKPAAPLTAIVVRPSGSSCGALVQRDGVLGLRLPSGRTVDIGDGRLTIVAACPRE